MPIPRLDFTGEEATITMAELRANPGEIIDRVARGLVCHVTKNGRPVATIVPAAAEGGKPLTFGLDLGGEYAQ